MRIVFFLCLFCNILSLSAEENPDIRPRFTGGLHRFLRRLNQNSRLAETEKHPKLAALLDNFYFPLRSYATTMKNSVTDNFSAVFLQNQTREFYLRLNIFEDKLNEFSQSLGEPPDNYGNDEEQSDSVESSPVETIETPENTTEKSEFSIKNDPNKTARKIIAETRKDTGRAKRGALMITNWLYGKTEVNNLENEAQNLLLVVPPKEDSKDPSVAYRHIPLLETQHN